MKRNDAVRVRSVGLALLLGCIGLAVVTSAQEDELASVSAALAPRAEGLIIARCSVCHSPDLVSQQRLPRERWLATVDKMKHWGAEMSEDEAALLVRYLSARYHPGAPDHLAPLDQELRKAEPLTQEPVAEGPLVGLADRGAGIFEHNCQACHGAGATGGMGPKLAKNPILKHDDLFWETVLHGRGPMPAWGSVLSHQDIADVQAWLLSK
ncbi:MAG: c-type cytochrome [Nitrospira sp.]|nr:c-type cytochrome [Nitrospira sp.]